MCLQCEGGHLALVQEPERESESEVVTQTGESVFVLGKGVLSGGVPRRNAYIKTFR